MATNRYYLNLRAACCAGLFRPQRGEEHQRSRQHHTAQPKGGAVNTPLPPELQRVWGGCKDHFSFRWRFAPGLYNHFRDIFCEVFTACLQGFLRGFYNIFTRLSARLLQHFYVVFCEAFTTFSQGFLGGFYNIFTRFSARFWNMFTRCFAKVLCKAFYNMFARCSV